MSCTQCGKSTPVDSRFCPFCRAAIPTTTQLPTPSKRYPGVQPSVIQAPISDAPLSSEDEWYEQALEELENGNPSKALWARSLAESNGDDAKARATYIRLRVAQLKAAYEAEQTARADAERVAKVEAERLANAEGKKVAKAEAERIAKAEPVQKDKEESDRLEKAAYGAAEPEARSGTRTKTKPQHALRILGVIALTIFFINNVMESNILRHNFQGNVFSEFYRISTYWFTPQSIASSFLEASQKEPYLWESENNKALQAGKAPEPVASTKVESTKKDAKGRPICVGQNWTVWTDCVGEMPYSNGGKYVGQFKNGKPNGQGTSTHSTGEKYVGEFRDGKRNGSGVLTGTISRQGLKYVGEFKDGTLNGKGTLTFGKDKRVGLFNGDNFNGTGTATFDNGKYDGEFRDSERTGQGTYTWSNGQKYVGEWRDGKQNGQGIEYGADGSVLRSGTWLNGDFIGGQ